MRYSATAAKQDGTLLRTELEVNSCLVQWQLEAVVPGLRAGRGAQLPFLVKSSHHWGRVLLGSALGHLLM